MGVIWPYTLDVVYKFDWWGGYRPTLSLLLQLSWVELGCDKIIWFISPGTLPCLRHSKLFSCPTTYQHWRGHFPSFSFCHTYCHALLFTHFRGTHYITVNSLKCLQIVSLQYSAFAYIFFSSPFSSLNLKLPNRCRQTKVLNPSPTGYCTYLEDYFVHFLFINLQF